MGKPGPSRNKLPENVRKQLETLLQELELSSHYQEASPEDKLKIWNQVSVINTILKYNTKTDTDEVAKEFLGSNRDFLRLWSDMRLSGSNPRDIIESEWEQRSKINKKKIQVPKDITRLLTDPWTMDLSTRALATEVGISATSVRKHVRTFLRKQAETLHKNPTCSFLIHIPRPSRIQSIHPYIADIRIRVVSWGWNKTTKDFVKQHVVPNLKSCFGNKTSISQTTRSEFEEKVGQKTFCKSIVTCKLSYRFAFEHLILYSNPKVIKNLPYFTSWDKYKALSPFDIISLIFASEKLAPVSEFSNDEIAYHQEFSLPVSCVVTCIPDNQTKKSLKITEALWKLT